MSREYLKPNFIWNLREIFELILIDFRVQFRSYPQIHGIKYPRYKFTDDVLESDWMISPSNMELTSPIIPPPNSSRKVENEGGSQHRSRNI